MARSRPKKRDPDGARGGQAPLPMLLLVAAGTSPRPPWTLWKEKVLTARNGRVIDVTQERIEWKTCPDPSGPSDRTHLAPTSPEAAAVSQAT